MEENKEHPTNLLERFSPDEENPKQTQELNSQYLHQPDLNLRLSLGINFEGESSLTRSSSVSGFMTQRKDSGESEKSALLLERSWSLPAKREQEQRLITLRELQAMRRIQAKNRLQERQRISRENKEKEKSKASLQKPMPSLPAPSPAKSPSPYQAIVNIKGKGDIADSQKGMYFPHLSPAFAALHGFPPLLFLLLIVGCNARPLYPLPSKIINGERQHLQTSRPYNLAHRGSNGEFPEETAAAYLRAIEEGADFIETDILSSKDGVLICMHDVTLDDTTDIANHEEFANRKTTYEVQGANTTGFFIVDFTLQELKTLGVNQRYKFRDQQYNEYISIALDAPRVVGIYPEIKNPVFINQHVKWPGGKKFEDKFVETLRKYGYHGSYMSKDWLKQPAFIQSFAPTSLVYVSNLTDLPKIFLIDDITVLTEDTKQTYWDITSDAYLDYMKEYVVGIGPWKDTVVPVVNKYMQTPTSLVARAHARNLQVHPYTFRNEDSFLHLDFHQDPYREYDYWLNKIGVDGLFTDFTGSLRLYQQWTSPLSKDKGDDEAKASKLLHKIKSLLFS